MPLSGVVAKYLVGRSSSKGRGRESSRRRQRQRQDRSKARYMGRTSTRMLEARALDPSSFFGAIIMRARLLSAPPHVWHKGLISPQSPPSGKQRPALRAPLRHKVAQGHASRPTEIEPLSQFTRWSSPCPPAGSSRPRQTRAAAADDRSRHVFGGLLLRCH